MSSDLDWHSALTASLCFTCKLLNDQRVFATDAQNFTQRYAASDLLKLEALAFALLLPSIAYIHDRAILFRTSLLDLAIDNVSSSQK